MLFQPWEQVADSSREFKWFPVLYLPGSPLQPQWGEQGAAGGGGENNIRTATY